MTGIYKVLSQSETVFITRQDGSNIEKSVIVLQELGGPYAQTYAAAMIGNQTRYGNGELVAASLRFTTHEYQQQHYQDVQVTELRRIA